MSPIPRFPFHQRGILDSGNRRFGIRQVIKQFLKLDPQNGDKLFGNSCFSRLLQQVGHVDRVPERVHCDERAVNDGMPVDLSRGGVRDGAAEPVPGIVEVILTR